MLKEQIYYYSHSFHHGFVSVLHKLHARIWWLPFVILGEMFPPGRQKSLAISLSVFCIWILNFVNKKSERNNLKKTKMLKELKDQTIDGKGGSRFAVRDSKKVPDQ